jgi:hypothetical protein
MPTFLNINPAGTVPVLVHKEHPIYESHEQIVYINDVIVYETIRKISTGQDSSKTNEIFDLFVC